MGTASVTATSFGGTSSTGGATSLGGSVSVGGALSSGGAGGTSRNTGGTVLLTTIVSGDDHSCALADGGVLCWGRNNYGQLGNGSTTDSAWPVPVQGLSQGVTALSARTNHTCALVNGGVKCWGHNDSGQLGNKDKTLKDSPVPVEVWGLTEGATAISAGYRHVCAVVKGAAKCWGENRYNNLGDGGTEPISESPVQVKGLTENVTAIAAGYKHSCAIVKGAAKCWGTNDSLQVGLDKTKRSSDAPVQVQGITENATAITAGYGHSCAVVSGAVKCWGRNFYGELGNDSSRYESPMSSPADSFIPLQVLGLTEGVTSISTGDDYTCAVAGGGIRCWGENKDGRLGDHATSNLVLTPKPLSAFNEGVTSVSTGKSHICALVNSRAKCLGQNHYGQLGNGTLDYSASPLQAEGLTQDATAIATGGNHTCALVGGEIYCWGENTSGQLGNGSTTDSPVPVQVKELSGKATAVSVGAAHTCALVDGAVFCWGYNSSGQLGNNDTSANRLAPVPVQGLSGKVTAIDAGGSHTCAIADGAVFCWGDNSSGQLGNNDSTRSSSPVPVPVQGLTGRATAVAAGGLHSCAIVDGAVFCWGDKTWGELGDGSVVDLSHDTFTSSLVPVQALGLSSGAIFLDADERNTCALVSGAALCWGMNWLGSDASRKAVPVQVRGLTSGVTAISVGTNGCAVVSGTAVCWGDNTSGQLGTGNLDASQIPVQVAGLTRVTAISTNKTSTCAVVEGAVLCWGSDRWGQLGSNGAACGAFAVDVLLP